MVAGSIQKWLLDQSKKGCWINPKMDDWSFSFRDGKEDEESFPICREFHSVGP
jgi:hypothetical protein